MWGDTGKCVHLQAAVFPAKPKCFPQMIDNGITQRKDALVSAALQQHGLSAVRKARLNGLAGCANLISHIVRPFPINGWLRTARIG